MEQALLEQRAYLLSVLAMARDTNSWNVRARRIKEEIEKIDKLLKEIAKVKLEE